MAKKIKTVIDVLAVPATEHILMVNFADGTCPFCGAPLSSEIVGWGRDKCRQYYPCSCVTAQAAEAHNEVRKAIERGRLQKERAEREAKERAAREAEAQKPVIITAAEMLCVASGCVIPGVEAVAADDKVSFRLKQAGYENGNAKERLALYAYMNDFSDGLEKAANEIVGYLRETGAIWETDVTPKVKALCAKYGVPETITI